MKIEEITIGDAIKLASMFGNRSTQAEARGDIGQQIVVLDRGFVYVGNVTEHSDRIEIQNAKNIRIWGTTNGLGELVNGPLPKTKLDACGSVMAYRNAVIHMIQCKGF